MKTIINGRLKKCFSALVSLIIVCLLIEGFFILVYWIQNKQYIPAQQAYQSIAPREYNLTQLSTCDRDRGLAPHPYLGFSRLAKSFCDEKLKNMSHTGVAIPAQKNPQEFYVLLTGASVPKQLLTSKPSLTKLLSGYTAQGKKIVVIDGTQAAWKQPQQLILLMLVLNRVDAVVTLEGFNELSFNRTYQYDHDFAIPFWPAYRKANLGTLISFSDHALLLVAEHAFLYVDEHSFLKKSRTAFFVLDGLRNHTRSTIRDMDAYPLAEQIEDVFRLPETWDLPTKREFFLMLIYAISEL